MFTELCALHKKLEEESDDEDDDVDVVSPGQVGAMIVDWTDPQKAAYVKGVSMSQSCH